MASLRVLLSLQPRVSPAALNEARSQLSTLSAPTRALAGFAGATGLGPIANLLGAGGIIGMATAAGSILKRSVDLALQLDRTAMNVTQTLDLGGAAILRNYRAFRSEALTAGISAGYGPQTMMQAMAVYGLQSGRPMGAVTRAAGPLAALSRAYGMEPTQMAAMAATLAPYTQNTPTGDMSQIAGAAGVSGDAGRRLSEFIGIATTTLVQLQGNMGASATLDQALRLQTFVTGSQNPYFRTPTGEAAGVQGLLGLVEGNQGNVGWSALAGRAGVNVMDILSGSPGKNNSNIFAMINELKREYGGSPQFMMQALVSKLGQQQGAQVYNLLEPYLKQKGPITEGSFSAATGDQIAKKFKDAMDGPFGQVQSAMAQLDSTETNLGENVLMSQVLPAMKALTTALQTGNIPKALSELTLTEKLMLGLLAVMGAKSIFPKALPFLTGMAGRLIGRAVTGLGGLGGDIAATDLGAALGLGGAAIGGVAGGVGLFEGLHAAIGDLATPDRVKYAEQKIMPNAPWLSHAQAVFMAGAMPLPKTVPYQAEIMAASKKWGVPAYLIAAEMMHESGGKSVISPVNSDGTRDYGLMQINSGAYRAFVKSGLWRDPASEIDFGTSIIAHHLLGEGGKTQAGQWQGLRKAIEDYNPGDPTYWQKIMGEFDTLMNDESPNVQSYVRTPNGMLRIVASFIPDASANVQARRKPQMGRTRSHAMGTA